MDNNELFENIKEETLCGMLTSAIHPVDGGEGDIKKQWNIVYDEYQKLKKLLAENGLSEDEYEEY